MYSWCTSDRVSDHMRGLIGWLQEDIKREETRLEHTTKAKDRAHIMGKIHGYRETIWTIENSTSIRWDDPQHDTLTRAAMGKQTLNT